MIIPLFGLIAGLLIGKIMTVRLPGLYSVYMSVAILACLDSVFGGLRAKVEGKFETDIFISGFFGNALLAYGLAYIGDRLNVPIYLAAVMVFGGRLFQNFAVIRRELIERIRNREKHVNMGLVKSGGNADENR